MGSGASKTSSVIAAPANIKSRSTPRLLSINVSEDRVQRPNSASLQSPKASLQSPKTSGCSLSGAKSPSRHKSPSAKDKKDIGDDEYADEEFESDTSEAPAAFPWKRGELLGMGSFGSVYLARNEYSGDLMAVKEISYDDDSADEVIAIQQEVLVLRCLHHSNIVKYMGSEYNEAARTLYIFTEWVPGGSLEDNTKTFGCSEPVAQKYIYQILLGIDYLHSKNVVHYDIKPSNILIDQHGGVKLADFGASRLLNASSVAQGKSLRGTPYYMAPEVVKQAGTSVKVDIWSLGCSVVKMLTGVPLWKTMKFQSQIALFFHIANLTAPPELPASISPVAKSFITACLQVSPEARPSAETLLKHPFIQQRHFSQAPTHAILHENLRGRATTACTTSMSPSRPQCSGDAPPRTAVPLFHPSHNYDVFGLHADKPPSHDQNNMQQEAHTTHEASATKRREDADDEEEDENDAMPMAKATSESVLPSLTPPKSTKKKKSAPIVPSIEATATHARSTSLASSKDLGANAGNRRHSHDISAGAEVVMPRLAAKDDHHPPVVSSPPKKKLYDETPILSDVAKRERDTVLEREAQKRKLKEEQARQWRDEQEAYRRSLAPG